MLDSLRPDIAETLDALGLHSGADALRWAHEAEGEQLALDARERGELDDLRDKIEAITEALIAKDAKGRLLAPGSFRKRIREIVG